VGMEFTAPGSQQCLAE